MSQQRFNPIELVELRLLQQGRIQYSDDNNWMRMTAGVIATVLAVLIAAAKIESGLLVAVVMVLGLGSTVAWIMRADNDVAKTRLTELESRDQQHP